MSNMELRMSFRLNEETKRRVMSCAAKGGVYSFSEVIRQGLELWLVREEMREEAILCLAAYETSDSLIEQPWDAPEFLYKLMETGK